MKEISKLEHCLSKIKPASKVDVLQNPVSCAIDAI